MLDALSLSVITVIIAVIIAIGIGLGLSIPDNIPNDEEYIIKQQTILIKKEVLIKNNLATYDKDTGEFILMIGE